MHGLKHFHRGVAAAWADAHRIGHAEQHHQRAAHGGRRVGGAGVHRHHAGSTRLQGQQAWNGQLACHVEGLLDAGALQQLVVQVGLGRGAHQQDDRVRMALGQHADDGCPVVFGPPLGVGGHPPAQAGTHGAAVAGLNQQQRLAQPPLGLQPVLYVGPHGGGNAQVRVAVVQVCLRFRGRCRVCCLGARCFCGLAHMGPGHLHALFRHVPQRRRLRPCQALRKVHQMLAIPRAHGLGANHPALVHACLSQQGQQLLVEVAIPDRTRTRLPQPLQQLALLGAQP